MRSGFVVCIGLTGRALLIFAATYYDYKLKFKTSKGLFQGFLKNSKSCLFLICDWPHQRVSIFVAHWKSNKPLKKNKKPIATMKPENANVFMIIL